MLLTLRPHFAAGTLLALGACASPAPPAPAPAAPAAPASSPAPAEPPPKPKASAEPAPSASAKPPADTRVRDACGQLCKRKAQCAGHDDAACQADCASHEEKSKGCEGPVAAALACQASAKESPCGNIAAGSCTDVFVKMQRCQRGEGEPEVASAKPPPAGWQATKDDSWGVTLLLPPGAALDTDAKIRRWKGVVDGVEYAVRELPRPKTLDDQAAVKLVIADVGVTCQQNMRLAGRVDASTLTFLRFETECGKGARVYGKLYVDTRRALSLTVRGGGPEALREAFLEGVR